VIDSYPPHSILFTILSEDLYLYGGLGKRFLIPRREGPKGFRSGKTYPSNLKEIVLFKTEKANGPNISMVL
jgi:hypothetical protein